LVDATFTERKALAPCTFSHLCGQTCASYRSHFISMKFFSLCIILLASAHWAWGGSAIALSSGEVLKYRVRWGIFTNAGTIEVSAHKEEVAGLPQVRIDTHTNTRGLVRALYAFDGDGQSIFDGRDGRLLAIRAWSANSKKTTKTMAVFDYAADKVHYVDYVDSSHDRDLDIPSGNAMDLITSLIETRHWDLHPGDRVPATIMFGHDFYDVVVVADSYAHVHVPLGDFDALVLVPKMEVNPRGLFKKGGSVRVWISRDERHLPVMFEVSMGFGTGTAELSQYTPPTEDVAAAKEPAQP
jgi:hypothetical protein